MKLVHLLFLSLLLITFSCNSDDDDSPLTIDGDEFGYDGPPSTSPFLPGGTAYEAAAYFPAGVLNNESARGLKDVNFFMQDIPATCWVKIYGPGTSTSPGDLLFEEDVSDRILAPAWNRFRLPEPLDVTSNDFWIAIEFFIDSQNPQQSIGCDAGPNKEGGDWTFFNSDGQWQTFRQRANGESINWNIRGILE